MRSDLLSNLLKEVSRSFYLTLRILPARVRPQIGLAYLLARTTDTIADTEVMPVSARLAALYQLRSRILGASREPLSFGALSENQSSTAERTLLQRAEESIALLNEFPDPDRRLIRQVIEIIASGQELDLQRFSNGSAERIVALQSDAELDDYTFRVAGCVGEFWMRICHAHLIPQTDLQSLLPNAIRFGKGLQLVNILRDLPRDLRNGRCYMPADRLAAIGLTPADLLDPKNEHRFRSLYDHYLGVAHAHLEAGWQYTNDIPRNQMRLRLACAWPILIGVDTLAKLKAERVLDPDRVVKISRREVRQILVRSLLFYPFPNRWKLLFCRGILGVD